MSTRFSFCLSLAIFVLLLGCQSEVVDNNVTAEKAAEKIGAVEGIENTVFKYDDGIYRGGDIVAQGGMDALKKMGVKTVFSVTPTDDERKFAKNSGVKLVEVPFTKTGIPAETLPAYLELLKGVEKPFYAHCHSGKNRGGTLLAAYRIHVQGWAFEKAKEEFIALGGKDSEFPELMESIKPQ